MEKIYSIENTVDTWGNTSITGYYSTFEKALQALDYCYDYERREGTGKIYEIDLDCGDPLGELIFSR